MWYDQVTIVTADITGLSVDAIVNAANSTLLGGGGVDGAIHRAAGPGLLSECMLLGGCPTGSAKITKGHRLPARYVIHTVGPVWRDGNREEDSLLASCYRSSFLVAATNGLSTIAFPAISTGAYGYPHERACRIALAEMRSLLGKNTTVRQVTFACFNNQTYQCYCNVLAEMSIADGSSG